MTRVIDVEHLTKRFGSVMALDDVSLGIDRGETVVLWGPNGAGKTTLLRCLLGVFPFHGTVRIDGIEVRTNGKAARRRLGYVPQDVRLPDHQSVQETVDFVARLRRVPPDVACARLAEWGFKPIQSKRVQELSGGMRQRLAIVLALMADPPILLLDEPTSHLDLRSRREFNGFLERLKTSGHTLVVCSHHAGEAWRLADRLIVLEQGRIVAGGNPETVLRTLGEDALVSLTFRAEHKAQAVAVLQQHGFVVHTNGSARQLWIRVAADRKIEPLRVLAEAQISVLDIELSGLLPVADDVAESP